MARMRSPNYPAIGLPEAIKRVEQVFAKEHRHPAPREIVVKHMGFGGVNGASLGAISAAGKYGLLDVSDGQYRVSERMLAILHPQTPAEKMEAIAAAARAPDLFVEILDNFPGTPPSDDNLRSYLIRRGFSQSSLGAVIQSFRETMELAPMAIPAHDPGQYELESEPVVPPGHPNLEPVPSRLVAAGAPTPHSLGAIIGGRGPMVAPPLPERGMRVELGTDGMVVSAVLHNEKDIDRLIQILTVNKILFQTTAEAGATEYEPDRSD